MGTVVEANLAKATGYLRRFAESPLGHFIRGEHVVAGDTFENTTPVDKSPLGLVCAGGEDEIDGAVAAAEVAFLEWRSLKGSERRKILHKVADAIEARAEEIAFVECMDTGQPLMFMRKAAQRGAANFRFFADKAAEAQNGLSLPAHQHLNYTVRHPIGPVAVITPWNTPFMLSTWKIAPALAAGCSVVQKPAELSPLTAMLLAEIVDGAGGPKGLVNCVNGFGHAAGKALSEHPGIKAVAFIGESGTGSQIQMQGAATLKRCHLELGGKNPVIVFEDADLDRALAAVTYMIYSNNGERCTSSSRLLVHRAIESEFLARVEERVKTLKIGHPLDPETVIGPLIHSSHYDKVCSYFGRAIEDGARIAVGGRAADTPYGGYYVEPTLFTGAHNQMGIAREEIFGPVLTAVPFSDEAEALALANDTQYGLAAYIWTRDVGRAHRMANAVEAGMVWVNSENNRHLPAPFGGVKMSGIGRDGGDYSFDFYMETKNVCIAYDTHGVPSLGN